MATVELSGYCHYRIAVEQQIIFRRAMAKVAGRLTVLAGVEIM
jgi:hypothetical protein